MTDKLSPRNHLYPRVCSVTGEGMMSGWVFGDGTHYIKHEADVIKELRNPDYELEDAATRDGDDLLQAAFELDICYYTEWEEYDNGYYTFDGRLLVEVHSEKCDNCGEETEWTSVHEFCQHCLHPMN